LNRRHQSAPHETPKQAKKLKAHPAFAVCEHDVTAAISNGPHWSKPQQQEQREVEYCFEAIYRCREAQNGQNL